MFAVENKGGRVTEFRQIREISKGQRFVGPLSLETLFSQKSPGKASRDRLIAEAVTAHGYSQMEVASFLGLHYSTISRILTVDKRANVKDLTLDARPLQLSAISEDDL
jgi:hypothetical protein